MIKIDLEFKNLIPPLSNEEFKQLEENIIKEGCRDSLVLWKDTLIDGHNRYEICSKHNISFNTVQREFAAREEVIEWIIRNQFGRRNLPSYVRTQLALRLEDVIKMRAKENQLSTLKQNTVSTILPERTIVNKIDTRKELAKIAGVSEGTIQKVKVINKKATPEQKKILETGKSKIEAVYKEIKLSECEVIKHKCNICGTIKPEKDFPKENKVRCRSCKAYIQSCREKGLEVDIEGLKSINVDFNAMLKELKEKPSFEGNLSKQPSPIITQVVNFLNTFNFNFQYLENVKSFEGLSGMEEIIEPLDKATKNLNKIQKLLEA